MGCHTWLYQETNRTNFEIRELAAKSVQRMCSWADIKQMQLDYGPTEHQVTEKQWSNILKKQENILHFGAWKQILDIVSEDLRFSTVYRGKLYEDADYHDTFRVSGYPENVLTSMQRTKAFIAKWQREKPNCISLVAPTHKWPGSMAKLEEFWAKYPTGIIKFG